MFTSSFNSRKNHKPRSLMVLRALLVSALGMSAVTAGFAQDDRLSEFDRADSSNWMPSIVISPAYELEEQRQKRSSSLEIQGTESLPDQPLTFTLTASSPLIAANQGNNFGLGAFWQLGRGVAEESGGRSDFSLANTVGVQFQLNETNFSNLPLATIECAGSQLTQRSVIASGCRLTDVKEQNLQLAIGYEPFNGLQTRAGVLQNQRSNGSNYFLQESDVNQSLLSGTATVNQLLGFGAGSSFGLQLGLTLELPAGDLGNIAVNADWYSTDYRLDTSVLSRSGLLTSFQAINGFGETLESARLQLGWSNGNFSGGIESIYQETPTLPGFSTGNDLTTFNVEFTWRTPWQGAFTVGASNVMDSGQEPPSANDGSGIDSIYGRIPYVRYKQDID